jgi:hypothetical protein
MKVSGAGALVGAGVGAVARSAVVFLNLGGDVPLAFLVPSAVVGVLVGGIAGATGRPWWGAGLGGLLSAVVFELFMLPCISLMGMLGEATGDEAAQGTFLKMTLSYALQMGLAGALAGGIGGAVGRLLDRRTPGNQPPTPPLAEKQT